MKSTELTNLNLANVVQISAIWLYAVTTEWNESSTGKNSRTCTGGSAVCPFTDVDLNFDTEIPRWPGTHIGEMRVRAYKRSNANVVCKVSQCPFIPPPLAITFGGEENVVANPRSFSHKRDLHVHVRGLRALACDDDVLIY